jgi:hypothetical protein
MCKASASADVSAFVASQARGSRAVSRCGGLPDFGLLLVGVMSGCLTGVHWLRSQCSPVCMQVWEVVLRSSVEWGRLGASQPIPLQVPTCCYRALASRLQHGGDSGPYQNGAHTLKPCWSTCRPCALQRQCSTTVAHVYVPGMCMHVPAGCQLPFP